MLQKILMILGYLFAAVVVVGGTLLLVAYGNGYTYSFSKNKIIHRGLVLLQSTPANATITFNGKLLKQKTPFRETYEGGDYEFKVSKAGFKEWHKSVEVTPAEVSLVQYIIMLPDRFTETTVKTFASTGITVPSRDRKRVAIQVASGKDAGIWSVETQSRNVVKIYTPAAQVEGQAPETDQIVSWSDDSSHLMVRRIVNGGAPELILLPASGNDASISLTTTFSTAIDAATFSRVSWRELYWQSPEGLRRLNVSDKTISSPIAAKVSGFTFTGDRLLYVDSSQPTASLWTVDRNGNNKQQLIPALPPSSTYQLAFATYIGEPEIVVVAPDSGKVILYSKIFNASEVSSRTIAAPADIAQFNGDGRFVLLSNADHVATYDLEKHRTYQFSAPNNIITGLSWFDNYHVLFNQSGKMVLAEYDSNYASAVTSVDAQAPFNTADDKSIMSTVQTTAGELQLKAVKVRQ